MARYVFGFYIGKKNPDWDDIPQLENMIKYMCHLIAKDTEEAMEIANQYIKDDNGEDDAKYLEVSFLIRKMMINAPLVSSIPFPSNKERLSVIRSTMQYWLDWQKVKRDGEGVLTNDDTHIIQPSEWPTRSVVKEWIKAIDSVVEPI